MDTEAVKNEPSHEIGTATEKSIESATQDPVQTVGAEIHEDVVITENEKAYAAALRRIFEIADDEELGDLQQHMSELQAKNEAIIAKAKESVISAEIRALQGYDSKLLDRLIDREKLTIDDNGKIKGFEEAVKAVEIEFPSVKLKEKASYKPFVPVNPADGDNTAGINRTMNDLIRGKR